jgi:hypothetical protein
MIPSFSQVQTVFKGGLMQLAFFGEEGHNAAPEGSTSQPSMLLSFGIRSRNPSLFNFGGELEYLHRTYDVDAKNGGVSGYTRYDLNVVENQLRINILPQFTFGKKVRFSIYPGVYLACNIYSKITGTGVYNGSGGHREYSYDKTYDEANMPIIEYGVLAGFGAEIPMGKGYSFVLDYMQSLNIPEKDVMKVAYLYILDFRFCAGFSYTIGQTSQVKAP